MMRARALVLVLAVLLVPACARREPSEDQRAADTATVAPEDSADTADRARAEALLTLALPKLDFWLSRWAAVDSSVGEGDSLELISVEDVRLVGAVTMNDNRAADHRRLRLLGVRAPDGKRAAVADWYRESRMEEGTVEPGFGEAPDSWAVLVDLSRDSVYTLSRVGTLGLFEEVRWIDDQHLLVTYSGEDPDEPGVFAGRVGVFDLSGGMAAWFQLPAVDSDAVNAYRSLLDEAERRRLAPLLAKSRS